MGKSSKTTLSKTKNSGSSREHVLICLALLAVTIAVFWRVAGFDYSGIDDDQFVRQNPFVQAGLAGESVKWAFTTTWQNIWQPLNWLSFMLDRQIAEGPGINHITNLLLHIGSLLLLYALLSRITRSKWRSAFVAMLFAVHPLHVESVAWITERKDVLSTLLWMIAMWSYVWYTEKPNVARYLLLAAVFALGLTSKPMLVTLPIVLLLLDYWPLKRLRSDASAKDGYPWKRLFGEKIPLLIMTLAASAVTYAVMQSKREIGNLVGHSKVESVVLALVNYARYILMMLWPTRLSVMYPDAHAMIPVWQVVLSAAVLIAISVLVLRYRRDRPYLAFGWLWYTITLLPVCGLVQTGVLMRADHYTYVPLIGLFIMIAWGAPDLAAALCKGRDSKTWLTGAAVLVTIALAAASYVQVGYWRNGTVLFTHALQVTENNCQANIGLGAAEAAEHHTARAMELFRKAVEIDPSSDSARYYLGTILAEQGNADEAILHLQKSVDLCPDNFTARNNLAVMLVQKGRLDEAIVQYKAAAKLEPGNLQVRQNLQNAEAQRAKQHR